MATQDALAYHEPGIETVLIQTGVIINQHRDYLHHPLHHGTGQDATRRRLGQRCHDGRRNGVGDDSNYFEFWRSSGFDPVIVIRPILVAFGFAIGLLLICRFGVARAVHFSLARKLHHRFPDVVKSSNFAFVAHMSVLIRLVAGATYAGTSGLFAAHLAGAGVSWFDKLLATATSTGSAAEGTEVQLDTSQRDSTMQSIASTQEEPTPQRPTGERIFEHFCKGSLKGILSPLFFVRSANPFLGKPSRLLKTNTA